MGDENEDQEQASPPVATETAPVPNNAPASGGMVLGGPLGVTMPSHTYGNTTTTPKVTDAYRRADEEQGQAFQGEGSAIQQETDAKVLAAQKQADIYAQQLPQDVAYLQQRQVAAEAARQRIEEQDRQAQLDQRIARAAANPTSYWDDRTAGERTQARIGVWLGVLGGALKQSDNNVALDYLNKQIDKDTQDKAARAERLFKLSESSRGALSDAYRQRAEDLADMDAQRAAGWDIVAKQVQAATMASQVPEARAQGAQLLAQVQEKGAQAKLSAQDKLTSTNVHEDKRTEAVTAASQPVAVRGAKGETLGAAPAHAAASIQADLALRDEAVGLAQQLKQLEEAPGLQGVANRTLPVGEAARTRQRLATSLLAVGKKIEGSVIGRGIDKNLLGGITGAEPGSHLESHGPQLQAYIDSLNGGATRLLKMQGVANANPQLGNTKQAAPAPPPTPKTQAQQLDLINAHYQAAKKAGDKAGMARAAKLLDLHTQAYGGGQ